MLAMMEPFEDRIVLDDRKKKEGGFPPGGGTGVRGERWGGNSSRLIPSPIMDRALGNSCHPIPECPYDGCSLYAYCL